MTSSNGNIFRVTDLLCGEFSAHRWIPRTKTCDAELWTNGRVNNPRTGDLRRHLAHYDVTVMGKFLTHPCGGDICVKYGGLIPWLTLIMHCFLIVNQWTLVFNKGFTNLLRTSVCEMVPMFQIFNSRKRTILSRVVSTEVLYFIIHRHVLLWFCTFV